MLGERRGRHLLVALHETAAFRCERDDNSAAILGIGLAPYRSFGDERLHQLGNRRRAELQMLGRKAHPQRAALEDEEETAALR